MSWPAVRDFFNNWPILHGIKTGLSALLALYGALVLQLENPTWALLTVFVLAVAPYVGAMAEKGFLRIVGTLIGGIFGTLIVGNFEQNPVLCLTLVFLIVAFCTYKYGGTTFPYAFFLCALTTTVIVGDSLSNPGASWTVAITRFLEISLGVCSSLLVNSLLWPRYAAREFRSQLQTLMQGTEALLSQVVVVGGPLPDEMVDASERAFTTRLEPLRQLLHFGACESNRFRRRLPNYSRLLTLANSLQLTTIALAEVRKLSPQVRDLMAEELGDIYAAVNREMQTAVQLPDASDWPLDENLAPAIARFDEHLRDLKLDGRLPSLPSDEILPFAAHFLGLRELADLLGKFREELAKLNQTGKVSVQPAQPPPGAFIEHFWIYNGIKGGIVTVISLILLNWLNPPGGTMIPLAAWIFTILSRVFLSWAGDRRSFQYAFYTAFFGVFYILLLLVLAPVLSSYAAASVLIFACFFVFGYLCIELKGITFWMQIGMFGLIGAVGLNPQSPVSFQAIMNAYFGVVIAMFLSAIVQRFLWPVTPQLELRHNLHCFIDACRNILKRPSDPLIQLWRKQIALTSAQATAWVEQFTTPEFPKDEQEKWNAALASLRAMGDQLRVCMKDAIRPEFDPFTALMTFKPGQYREKHDMILAEFDEVFSGRLPAEKLTLSPEMPLVDEFKRLRDSGAFLKCDLDLTFQFYGHIARCQRLHLESQRCIERIKSLQLNRYMGDYAL